MSENQKKILQMLADGKINVDEAQRLLSLVSPRDEDEPRPGNSALGTRTLPRYIHVIIQPKAGAMDVSGLAHSHHRVNVRVPLNLIRAGMKFAALIPSDAAQHVNQAFKENGLTFDIKKIKDEDLNDLISALEDSEINVDNDDESIRIYSE